MNITTEDVYIALHVWGMEIRDMRGDGGDESVMTFCVLLKLLDLILAIRGVEVTLSGVCLKKMIVSAV